MLDQTNRSISSENFTEKNVIRLTRVIAIVGCDGAGKSTLGEDLCRHLGNEYPVQMVYLGQDSGNILRSIRNLPLIGSVVGKFLVKKSQQAHAKNGEPPSPDVATALVVYLLSRWRHHKFKRMLTLHRQGKLIITDRYPQSEVPGLHFDGPGLIVTDRTTGFVRWLAKRELRLYQAMAAHVPALLIRLNIDAETAHARKPDHKLKTLQEKARVIPTLAFNRASILDLDARLPYTEVLRLALLATQQTLASHNRDDLPKEDNVSTAR